MKKLTEGKDFYFEVIDGHKFKVFTKEYLQSVRKKCCRNYCRHCPWDYKKTKK
jgi:hypothetical protein